MRSLVGPGLLIGGVLLGLSCSGPAPDVTPTAETDARVYHVQLDETQQKAEADRMVGRVLEWWEKQAATVGPRPVETASSPVSVAWRAPLYRVRLGPFASRAGADSVLAAAQRTFPGAFVRPERASSTP